MEEAATDLIVDKAEITEADKVLLAAIRKIQPKASDSRVAAVLGDLTALRETLGEINVKIGKLETQGINLEELNRKQAAAIAVAREEKGNSGGFLARLDEWFFGLAPEEDDARSGEDGAGGPNDGADGDGDDNGEEGEGEESEDGTG